MNKITPFKNLSLLGLILLSASAVTAAFIPDKLNKKRANNGTLRVFSATAAGGDQDSPEGIISCIARGGSAFSCTATSSCTTTAGIGEVDSCCPKGADFRYQTIGNTSQTNPNDGVDQTSTLALCDI